MSDLKKVDSMEIVKAATNSIETADRIRESYQWKKVKAPRHWRPKNPGEELVGYYGGRTVKNGAYGQYEVVIIHVPMSGSFMLTGTVLIQLLDSSMIEAGHPVRVVWLGSMPHGEDKTIKQYELFVAEGEPIPVEAMPRVHQ